MKKIDWKSLWLISYGVGLVLIPPIHFHEKSYFAAEWMLLPLVIALGAMTFKGKLEKPSQALVFAWGGALIALIAGYFRGDLATQITQYPLENGEFSLRSDGITFLRWIVILGTPWIIKNIFKDEKYLNLFFKTLSVAFLISGLLTLADHFHLLSLENWGYYKTSTLNWVGRSYGTFPSPNEGGLMYGAFAVYLLTVEKKLFTALSVSTLAVVLGALALTHCGTAMATLVIAVFAHIALTEGRGWKVYSILGALILAGYTFTTKHGNNFFTQKINDLGIRQITWRNWIQVAPANTHIVFFGIGFSKLVVDNSIILLLIQGGFIFVASVLRWIKECMTHTLPELKFIFFFWGLSWLTLDSITYWGVGRLCWLLFGLAFLVNPKTQKNKI